MGDVLHALPAVMALRQERPRVGDRLGGRSAMGRPAWTGARQGARGGDEASGRFSPGTLGRIGRLRSELRAARYDVCVDMQGTIRSAAIGRLSHAPVLAGYRDPREVQARWLYTHTSERRGVHVVEQGCALLGESVRTTLSPAPVLLPSNPAAEVWCDDVLAAEERFCFIAPRAGWGAKVWPAERYGTVARQLAGMGYAVVVNAVGDHDAVANRVVEESGGLARAVLLNPR